MIVTLTANPSLDRTVTLSTPLRVGEVQSALSVREDPGGKGINVTRVVVGAGMRSAAVLPLDADDPFAGVLRSAAVPVVPVPLPGAARANLTIVDGGGVTTKVNLPGVTRTQADAEALVAATVQAARGARWLVLAGSLPPGVADSFYVDVIRAVRAAGDPPRIAVDTSGAALHAVVAAGAPDLIKPNDDELAELTGVALDAGRDLADAVRVAAADLVPARVGAAFVTLGAAGAVEAVYSIMAIQEQICPPTLNLDDPADELADFDLVPLKAKKREIKAAMSNSFGFGGTNASLVLRRYS